MVNAVTAAGIVTDTLQEIIDRRTAQYRVIYGSDINVDQNSPDGQFINIISQAERDLLDQAEEVYNSFDPDNANGKSLDARVAINAIQRNGGTFTITPIDITVDRALTLDGLDAEATNINGEGFTVADDAGTEFILLTTTAFGGAGTLTLDFRAKEKGKVETLPNTITNQITIVTGVTVVNNPTVATTIGTDEETDSELKIRRQNSVAIPALGYLDAIEASILNLDTVSDARVYENVTSVTDADGIPPHSIWAVVEGGADADIAQTIYAKKSYGSDMKGAVEINIVRPNGGVFVARFDRPVQQDIFIRFGLSPKFPSATFDADFVKQSLEDQKKYSIGEQANGADITDLLIDIVPDFVSFDVEISPDDIVFSEILNVASLENKFIVDTSRITILP